MEMKLFETVYEFLMDKTGTNLGEYVAIGAIILVGGAAVLGTVSGAINGKLGEIAGAI
jgi:Flp pilus assembly pilin Flp